MLTHTDILSLSEFEKIRSIKKSEIISLKKSRRLSIGPDITFYFENIQTIWWQIQEMLRIEKGSNGQVEDELNAYNPLIPINSQNSYEISATMMIEIDDPIRRQVILKQLFGIDNHIFIELDDISIQAFNIDNAERNRESDQKTSSVHFLKWRLLPRYVNEFLEKNVNLCIKNPYYSFKKILPLSLKNSLKDDFRL